MVTTSSQMRFRCMRADRFSRRSGDSFPCSLGDSSASAAEATIVYAEVF